jgi:outer membrane protein assembly factor BamB
MTRQLRLWPGVVAGVLQCVLWVVPFVVPAVGMVAFFGAAACALATVVWWLFFSRALWIERVGALVLMVVAVAGTYRVVHPSIANGAMGMLLPIFSVPFLSLGLVAWAVTTRRLSDATRRAALVVVVLVVCGAFTLLRTGGMSGEGTPDLHWRWTQSPEERLIAEERDEPVVLTAASPAASAPPASSQPGAAPAALAPPSSTPPSLPTTSERGVTSDAPANSSAGKTNVTWPGFRGPARDSVVTGVQIDTDWSRNPPAQMWRRPIGPGWSSFAVRGNVVYTQEQRGEEEIVAAYRLDTGAPVWKHRDAVRFWESNAGAGPRGTPTLSDGRVYALGGTGLLNALDARDGSVVWSRNPATEMGRKVPDWGIAGSPLVVNDTVVVAAAGWLAAYDIATGKPRWFGPKSGGGYSSPHLSTIDGVPQVLILTGAALIGVNPSTGHLLWKHEWGGDGILQPALIGDGDFLIGSGSGLAEVGTRRLTVAQDGEGWSVKERWTSNRLKPYFNDIVVHEGHAYGFDGGILACIDLANGERKWKGGRYGHGQFLLLAEQDALLVLSEEGELAVVKASPDQFTELARFKAIDGKTWNHPVLAGDVLLVRNGEEMAAFRLSLAGR